MLRIKQVLTVDMEIIDITENISCQRCVTKNVKELGALRIAEEDIYELIEEIRRSDQFDK